jgi:type I restriction enzyme, S subunit
MKNENISTKMKDSGIEWIGEIPEEWEVRKIKFSAKTRNEKYSELYGKLDYFGLENIESQSAKYIATDNIYDIEQAQICKKGDIAFGKLRPYLAKIFEVPKTECCSSEFVLFHNFLGINTFYKYLFLSHGFINIVDSSTYGTKMPRANADFIKNLFIPVPPFPTQQNIATFLDKKCAAIDSAVEKELLLIEKLKSYKQSVITQAVTKGIRPNRKMKQSGIEWIGEIPQEWEVRRINHFFVNRKHKNKGMEENNLLSLSYGNIVRKNIETKEGLLPDSFETYNIIESGDIVFRLTDLQNDKHSLRTGLCKEKGIITSAYITLITPKDVNCVYMHYLFHIYDICKVFYNMGDGVRQGMNYDDLCKLSVLIPPFPTQQNIATFLDKKCTAIESAISKKTSLIDKLKEYKKSLIYECVTGKRECCNF